MNKICFVKTGKNSQIFEKIYFNYNLEYHDIVSIYGFIPYNNKKYSTFSELLFNKMDLITEKIYSELSDSLKHEYTKVNDKYFKVKPVIFISYSHLNDLRILPWFKEYTIIINPQDFENYKFRNSIIDPYFRLISDENFKYGCINFNRKYNHNILVLDTETSYIPKYMNHVIPNYTQMENFENSRLLSLSWIIVDDKFNKLKSANYLIKDKSFKNSEEAFKVNHIDDNVRNENGLLFKDVYKEFIKDLESVSFVMCHGSDFDYNIILFECLKHYLDDSIFKNNYLLNTKQNLYKHGENIGLCNIVNGNKNKAHNSLYDSELCLELFKMRL